METPPVQQAQDLIVQILRQFGAQHKLDYAGAVRATTNALSIVNATHLANHQQLNGA